MRLTRSRTFSLLVAAAILYALPCQQLHANPLIVAGSPSFNSATGTGATDGYGNSANNTGTAVGSASKWVSGVSLGDRAVRWDSTGTAATELGNLGTDASGLTSAYANAINTAGTSIGYALKYVSGTSKGDRAVRWDPSGTAATELGNLGTDASGLTTTIANDINDAGTTVGDAIKFASGTNLGSRAVRWDASGTTATELGNIGTAGNGATSAVAIAVNATGAVVGYAEKYNSGTFAGNRAVRWDASGTAATELGNLGTDSSGTTFAFAGALNAAGTAVGTATKYVSGISMGDRAVRWSSSGTAATELGNLGVDSNGYSESHALGVNTSGTAVGYAYKYVSGINLGYRAVRWNSSGTAATELGNLGTDSSGGSFANATALNVAGTAVGQASKYVSGVYQSDHAVIWLPDASAVDLNDLGVLANPADGTWQLSQAQSLSADGWVTGNGTFTPTSGAAYQRGWVAQVGLGGTWTNSFTGTYNGTWGRGPQWSTGTPAMQVGDATFSARSTYAVGFDRNELTRSITVSSGDVTFNLGGRTLTSLTGLGISNARLAASGGTLASAVTVGSGGRLAPGATVATLSINSNLSFASGSTLELPANTSAPLPTNSAGLINVNGNLSIASDARLEINDLGSSTFSPGTKLSAISYSGTWDGGQFTGHPDDKISFFKGRGYLVNYNDISPGVNQGGGAYGNRLSLTTTSLFVPLLAAGAPAYDSTTGMGFTDSTSINVSDAGTTAGNATKYVSGISKRTRAVRWDASGTAATELGNLGTDNFGSTDVQASAVNAAGTAVGYARKYVANTDLSFRAVRWDASGTAATELGSLGTDNTGYTYAQANAINAAGTAVGYAYKYVSGTNFGTRAVRWDASGTAATELGNLGTSSSGSTNAYAYAVNAAGTAVGNADKWVSGTVLGSRAVRWDASGTAATELGNLGTDSSGSTIASAVVVNAAGTAAGYATKYVSGTSLGQHPVRWDSSGTVATELGDLGVPSEVQVLAINAAGTAVGFARKIVPGKNLGYRAVRWDASGTAATELGNLGTDSSGSTFFNSALALNVAGTSTPAISRSIRTASHLLPSSAPRSPAAPHSTSETAQPAARSWETLLTTAYSQSPAALPTQLPTRPRSPSPAAARPASLMLAI